MKNEMILGYALAAVLSLGACSSKVSGLNGIDGKVNKAGDVSGPSVEGQWKSACIANPLAYDGYRTLQINFTGANFQHTEEDFSDASCTEKVDGGETLKGTFSFTRNIGGGVYQIEYRIPVDSNVSALRDLRLSVSGDTLKVSTWLSGFGDEDKDVAPSIALTRVNGAATAPAPAPAPGAPTTSAPKPATANLLSGVYLSSTSEYCNADISTASSNGQVFQVYMQMESPCSGSTLQFDCEGTECTDSEDGSLSVSLKDANHFTLNIPSDGRNIGYSRK